RVEAREVPDAFKPRETGLLAVSASALEANARGVVESRLLHTFFSDDLRSRFSVRQIVSLAIPERNDPSVLIVGLAEADALTAAHQSAVESLAAEAVRFLSPSTLAATELDVLRRLDAAEALLPALFRVLDVREIFDQLSAVAKRVLPHDFAGLGVY